MLAQKYPQMFMCVDVKRCRIAFRVFNNTRVSGITRDATCLLLEMEPEREREREKVSGCWKSTWSKRDVFEDEE